MATGEQATVTVCIATKDRAHRLPAAIESVLSQTYRAIELFVVDDGSADGTSDVIARYAAADSRLQPVKHETSQGLAAARNVAVHRGRGDYFSFLDDDDIWSLEFIASCVWVAVSAPEAAAFCTGYRVSGALGGSQEYLPELHAPLRLLIEAGYTPPVAAQFYRMNAIREVGGYDERVKSGVDHDLWLRLAANGAVLSSVPQVLAFPDTNLEGPDRMTTDFSARRRKIANSLELWRPTLQTSFSPGFYGHFVKSYEYAIVRKEVAAALSAGRRLRALLLSLRAPFKRELLRFVSRKLSRRRVTVGPQAVPPSFPPYHKAAK